MTKALFLATSDGVVGCRREPGGWREGDRSLIGRTVTSVMTREGVVLAGTTDGVMRSEDGGRTWDEAGAGLTVRHVRWLAYHPAISDREFAGTEPAGIFVSHDGARARRAGGSRGEPVFVIPPASLVHADVHAVVVHPPSPDLVFAATAEGLYRSA